MMYVQDRVVDIGTLQADVESLLRDLGTGRMDSVAYDTGWLARLAPLFPGHGFDGAIDWLRTHQHADGSWGSAVKHYHDRTISTLSALIALKTVGNHADEKRIRRGIRFLWRTYGHLYMDANDTANFKGLVTMLTAEATALCLEVPPYNYRGNAAIQKKLAAMRAYPRHRHPLVVSLEFLGADIAGNAEFVEANGSIAASPSTTAALLLNSDVVDPQTLDYLSAAVNPDGGVPAFMPIDLFEIAWSLNQLQLAGAITPDHPQVRRCLDILWAAWEASPNHEGVGFSTHTDMPDLDDTATSFSVLQWGGYPVNADVFGVYEESDHFHCYPNETDPSLSTHIQTLAALRTVADHPYRDEWIEKAAAFLRQNYKGDGLWFDKFHISPYYLSRTALRAMNGICDDLVKAYAEWIIKTQRPDGGWGYYQASTLEETAYCLQALTFYNREVATVDPAQLAAAAAYLVENMYTAETPPLWIGKCLYTAPQIVRSAVVAALYGYQASCEDGVHTAPTGMNS